MKEEHVALAVDAVRHLWSQGPTVPIQNHNDALLWCIRGGQHPLQGFHHVLRAIRPVLLRLDLHPRTQATRGLQLFPDGTVKGCPEENGALLRRGGVLVEPRESGKHFGYSRFVCDLVVESNGAYQVPAVVLGRWSVDGNGRLLIHQV